MKKLVMILVMAFSTLSYSAILCPPDSCNPFNGCMDGCSSEQKKCSLNSVPSCIGKEIYSTCQISSQPHQPEKGFCSAVGATGDKVSCACD